MRSRLLAHNVHEEERSHDADALDQARGLLVVAERTDAAVDVVACAAKHVSSEHGERTFPAHRYQ